MAKIISNLLNNLSALIVIPFGTFILLVVYLYLLRLGKAYADYTEKSRLHGF
jgi:hypothetical protein